MSGGPISGVLYNAFGYPVSDRPLPPLKHDPGVLRSRPICRILFDLDQPDAAERTDEDLIYALPLGARPHAIDALDLAEMVAVMDRGGRIALHGTDEDAVAAAIDAILRMSGGARA